MITNQFFSDRRRRLSIAGFVNTENEYPERSQYQLSIYTMIKEKISERVEKIQKLPSVYICGAVQTGKTSLMKLAADLYLDANQTVFYTTTAEYMTYFGKRTGTWIEKEESSNYMNKCNSVNALFLDNLSWSFDTDYQFRTIIELIRYRYDRKLPMVLASNVNLSNKKNKNQYEEQLVAYLDPKKDHYLNFIYDNKKQLNNDNLKQFYPKYSVLNELNFAKEPEPVKPTTSKRTETESREYKRKAYTLCVLLLDKTIKIADCINYEIPGEGGVPIGCTDIEKTYKKLITDGIIKLTKDQLEKVRELRQEVEEDKYKRPESGYVDGKFIN